MGDLWIVFLADIRVAEGMPEVNNGHDGAVTGVSWSLIVEQISFSNVWAQAANLLHPARRNSNIVVTIEEQPRAYRTKHKEAHSCNLNGSPSCLLRDLAVEAILFSKEGVKQSSFHKEVGEVAPQKA